jgi:DNA-binding NarL/FixJ family response regulator
MVNRKSESKKTIFIVDDHPMTRFGIQELIHADATLTIVGESDNAEDTLEKVQKIKPDLLLVDLTLKGRSGLELIKDLRKVQPEIEILVFSMHEETFYAERVLRAGARGYVMKSEGTEQLLQAIRTVLTGKVFVSDLVANNFLNKMTGRQTEASSSPVSRLTDRELEVLAMVGKARESRDIAKLLSMSVKTVEAHRASIRQKLDIKTRAELVRFAVLWMAETGADEISTP